MATAVYPGHRRPASARIVLRPDGTALVQAATQEVGGGTDTVMAQVAADALGLPVERVRFELGDSRLPEAPFSAGSVTCASVSEAIVEAAAAMKERLAELAPPGSPLAGLRIDNIVLRDGRLVSVEDPARGIAVRQLLERADDGGVAVIGRARTPDPGTESHEIHSFGAHFCEVRIDPASPRVRVARFVSVMDVGRVLNLRTARSQVIGGVVWGVGMALMEHTVYDPRTGLPVNANLADYTIPVNADIESIEVEFVDEPDPVLNTTGCRGAGELGITGAAAAVANAVFHATGRRVRELPITPDRLLA